MRSQKAMSGRIRVTRLGLERLEPRFVFAGLVAPEAIELFPVEQAADWSQDAWTLEIEEVGEWDARGDESFEFEVGLELVGEMFMMMAGSEEAVYDEEVVLEETHFEWDVEYADETMVFAMSMIGQPEEFELFDAELAADVEIIEPMWEGDDLTPVLFALRGGVEELADADGVGKLEVTDEVYFDDAPVLDGEIYTLTSMDSDGPVEEPLDERKWSTDVPVLFVLRGNVAETGEVDEEPRVIEVDSGGETADIYTLASGSDPLLLNEGDHAEIDVIAMSGVNEHSEPLLQLLTLDVTTARSVAAPVQASVASRSGSASINEANVDAVPLPDDRQTDDVDAELPPRDAEPATDDEFWSVPVAEALAAAVDDELLEAVAR